MISETNNIICPACKSLMETVYIPSLGLNVNICTECCGGIFFNENDFNQYYNHPESKNDFSEYMNKYYEPTNPHAKRQCPNCGADMTKSMIKNNSIEVSVCNNCDSVFIDNDELKQLCEHDD